MLLKEDKRLMRKEIVYILFILKFLLGIYLIYWTIATTLSSDVGKDEDLAFLNTYHNVDDNFNNMIASNQKFDAKYNIKFDFNGTQIIGLTVDDVFLARRAVELRDTRRDMIFVGKNKFTILVQDKQGNIITTKNIDIRVTKNTTHTENVDLKFVNEDTKEFDIGSIGYWNITGTVEIDSDKGFFYIKTNAKKPL